MITSHDLTEYINQYLACNTIVDYAPNGLQIEGQGTIHRLCTAVSASQQVINEAIAWKADALLVHHGFFWRGERAEITGVRRKRIGALISNNINLFAYHLPLDVHMQVGNNACIASLLEANDVTQHDVGQLKNGLWAGTLPQVMSSSQFFISLQHIFKQAPIHIPARKVNINRVAWCSGAAQDFLEQAQQLGIDAYISGEISERTFDMAKELNIHYFACGHHATERYGVQALGAHLETMFGLRHRFIDSDNPI